MSASSQGESHHGSVCRKPAILDYVICSADPRAGSTVLEVQRCGKGGGAWTSQVAIKRSRSIEANTLTSTYQSSCLAIKQVPTVEKNKPPPCSIPPVVGCWWSSGARRAAKLIFISPQPPSKGGVGGPIKLQDCGFDACCLAIFLVMDVGHDGQLSNLGSDSQFAMFHIISFHSSAG